MGEELPCLVPTRFPVVPEPWWCVKEVGNGLQGVAKGDGCEWGWWRARVRRGGQRRTATSKGAGDSKRDG